MNYKNGVLASLAGGVVLSIIMTAVGSIGTVAGIVGSSSALVGWIVALVGSALLGALFQAIFGDRIASGKMNSLTSGFIYGFACYVLGSMTLLPLLTSNSVLWTGSGITGSLDALVGQLVYGGVLGLAYQKLNEKDARGSKAAA